MSESGFTIVGIGGAGGKIANAVADRNDGRIRTFAVDTDFSAISRLGRCQQKRIGATRFDGAGSGGDKSGAGMAADEAPDLGTVFDDTRVAAIVAGIGKGTGSGVLPKILAKAAERNVATIVFMVAPFQFEGLELSRRAAETEQTVSKLGDVRIICKNDDLCPLLPDLTLEEAFANATDKLADGITLIWKMAMLPGYINVDPATLVKIVRNGRGTCHLGLGIANGPQRVKVAMSSLLGNGGMGLGSKLTGAKAALVGIIGGEDLMLKEVADTMQAMGSALSMDAEIKMGTVLDRTEKSGIRIVTLLFREWNPLYGPDQSAEEPETPLRAGVAGRFAASPDASAKGRDRKARQGSRRPINDRFQDSTATCIDGENLDRPTYLRRKLHIDLS